MTQPVSATSCLGKPGQSWQELARSQCLLDEKGKPSLLFRMGSSQGRSLTTPHPDLSFGSRTLLTIPIFVHLFLNFAHTLSHLILKSLRRQLKVNLRTLELPWEGNLLEKFLDYGNGKRLPSTEIRKIVSYEFQLKMEERGCEREESVGEYVGAEGK